MIRMIVADDAPFIREIVRHVASSNGIEIVGEAADGDEAVQLALKLNPDVILMDVVMPNKSGIEAAKELAEKAPNIKIIAFSTTDQETMVLKALEAGCCSYLVKPFKADELVRVVTASLVL